MGTYRACLRMAWPPSGRKPSRVPIRTNAVMLRADNAIITATSHQLLRLEDLRIEIVEAPQAVDEAVLVQSGPGSHLNPLVGLALGLDVTKHRATRSVPIKWGALRAAVPSLCCTTGLSIERGGHRSGRVMYKKATSVIMSTPLTGASKYPGEA